ncbi:MAG TPA: amino acid ABC transporter substrate-binding protein [Casimicrobiaceae bacterium]|nr:amino acid ABC transporter substrate-binding protein [Casimicrobiaceae bacterium]
MSIFRHLLAATTIAVLALGASAAIAAPSGQPIRIGSTLALTGPLAATAQIHKLVGDIYVEQLNAKDGLLGRPVEWIVRDDQSKPELARTLYEQLITVDKVDLLMGPYATGAILSAMGVAQRYNKMLIHHTFGIPSLAKYEMQFPTWSLGPDPAVTFPNTLFDALAASPQPPKTIAIVTSKFPSVHFMALGARDVAKKRGLSEVLFLEWEFGNKDFGPIAARVKEANPDFMFVGALGLEGNQLLDALKKIDYTPKEHFYMYPAPGSMAKSQEGDLALAGTIFEEHAPFTNNPGAAAFIKVFNERAAKVGLTDTSVDTQAAASYTAWQVLEAAVTATKSLDDKVLAEWLRTHKVDTIQGKIRFDGPSNYGDDLMRVKQVQNGKWVVVWPKEAAAPGAKLTVR